jgi:hypothetical protein
MSKAPKGGSRTGDDEDTKREGRPTDVTPPKAPGKPVTQEEADAIMEAVLSGKSDKQIKAMIAKMFRESN